MTRSLMSQTEGVPWEVNLELLSNPTSRVTTYSTNDALEYISNHWVSLNQLLRDVFFGIWLVMLVGNYSKTRHAVFESQQPSENIHKPNRWFATGHAKSQTHKVLLYSSGMSESGKIMQCDL